jgi:hypothetical protein
MAALLFGCGAVGHGIDGLGASDHVMLAVVLLAMA